MSVLDYLAFFVGGVGVIVLGIMGLNFMLDLMSAPYDGDDF